MLPVVIGPPPVPRMCRSSSNSRRLAQVRRRQEDIDGDVIDQALLTKLESLLMLQPPRRNVAATFADGAAAGPGTRVRRVAKQGNIDLLLPETRSRLVGAGRRQQAMFDKASGAMRTANFGVSGDTTVCSGG